MSRFKATKPKAAGGLCWHCDRKLYAGGRAYVLVIVDGYERPMHRQCSTEREAGKMMSFPFPM